MQVCCSLSMGWEAQPQSFVHVLLKKPKSGKMQCSGGHSARTLFPFSDTCGTENQVNS